MSGQFPSVGEGHRPAIELYRYLADDSVRF